MSTGALMSIDFLTTVNDSESCQLGFKGLVNFRQKSIHGLLALLSNYYTK